MTLQEITKEIIRLNKYLDGFSDDLLSVIEKYQTAYERLLFKKSFDLKSGNLKSTLKNYNIAQSMNPMEELGFNELALSHVGVYSHVSKNQLLFNKRIGIISDINFKDLTILKQLQKIDFSVFYAKALLLDEMIKREIVNAIALEMPYKDTVTNLAESMLGAGEKSGTLAQYANTYMRTSLFNLTKSIDMEIYGKFEIEEFMYTGPVDAYTRPFCLAHVGNIYTTKEIEKFPEQNGSGLNGFVNPGGWNCRHRLIPPEDIS